MSQVVTTEAALLTIFKTWYSPDKIENLLFRNSPLARMLRKERIGGKEYAFAAISGRGGAVSGDATVAAANGSAGKNVEFKVQPGNLFSFFTITDKEIKGSKGDKRAAYIPALADKMFACLEAFRKTFAACLYGAGYGEVGRFQSAVSSTGAVVTFTVPEDVIFKIDIGTKFEVTDGIELDDDYLADGPFTVTAIDGLSITVTPAVPNGGFVAGAWMQIEGGRDSSKVPNMITGLGAWLPSYFNRSGALWTSYIGTSFYGVTRSSAVQRLAGVYVERVLSGTPETYKHTITRAVRAVRAAGSLADIIVMNDADVAILLDEIDGDTTYWQANNSSDKGKSNEVAFGIEKMSVMFQSSWIKNIYDDPYCPQGTAYILDSQRIKLVALSNVETPMDDGIKGNDPGSQSPESTSTPSMDYSLSIEDFISVNPSSLSQNGAGASVLLSMFANIVISNPAHCAVINFDSTLYQTTEGT
jgi:hypothetical protein